MRNINIGVIGLGRIGKVHLESLAVRLPMANVVAASDPDPSTHEFARKLGVTNVTTSSADILQNPDIEAVVLCSPTPTHLDFIKKAADAGQHIFCEKPLEMTVEKIREIDSYVRAKKVKLQVGFNRRFDANFSKVRALVESGKIGEPHLLKITSRDPGPPPIEYIKVSGGLFMDMTIHDFDMARFIAGSEVTEVFAWADVRVDPAIGEAGDIDTAIINLKFENGLLGVIDNSRKAVYGYDQRVEIFGSGGMTRIGNNYPDTHIYYDHTGGHSALPLNFFMERYTEAYFNEMRDFILAIQENKPVPVDSHDALMATVIAMAGYKSLKTGRPVKLTEILTE